MRVITCQDCHAENAPGATVCQACGHALPQAEAASAPLPQWLQQLKPEVEREAPLVAKTPAGAANATMPGTDSVVAPVRSAAARVAAEGGQDKGGAQASVTETASLISEDDLPAWLRAFGEVESRQQATAASDESWMVGAGAEQADSPTTQDLTQSWQAPSQPAAARSRTGATSIFAKPAEGPAKPERVIAASAPTVAPVREPEPPARTEMPRPLPTPRKPVGAQLQRVALVAFLVALVIFLIVVGVFLIKPSIG